MSFVGSEFPGSHRKLRMPSNTFWTFIVGVSEPVRVFHPMEYLALLVITRHKFSLPFRSTVRICWTLSNGTEPTQSNSKCSVDFQLCTPMICDESMQMQCNVPLCVISCHMYDEHYMDNIIHTTHRVSRTITSYAYDFHTSIYSCQYIMHAYININIQCVIPCSSNDTLTIKPYDGQFSCINSSHA